MDSLYIALTTSGGMIILSVAVLAYIAGMRKGSRKSNTEDIGIESLLKDLGLSQTSIQLIKGYIRSRQVWEEKRSPDRFRFKPVDID